MGRAAQVIVRTQENVAFTTGATHDRKTHKIVRIERALRQKCWSAAAWRRVDVGRDLAVLLAIPLILPPAVRRTVEHPSCTEPPEMCVDFLR
jgi:hypothetical protein